MKHLIALLIKFAVIAIITEVILGLFTSLNFSQILYMAAAVTLIAYLIGDLIIFPTSNNIVASIADLGFHFLSYIHSIIYGGIGKSLSLMH